MPTRTMGPAPTRPHQPPARHSSPDAPGVRAGVFRGVLFAALVATTTATADVGTKLAAYEIEARALAADLPEPNRMTGAQGQRRLVDAEVSFSLGDYDGAALMLFELASKPGADQETATYYLAEALFQKGDRGAARGYYEHVVAKSTASRYYQPSLLRLVEIAIAQRDTTNIDQVLAALDRVGSQRLPEVPYVRGKFAFFQGKHDEALTYFQDVPKGSVQELQALYYTGTTLVAKKDLGRASEVFTDLIARTPRVPNDRRVIELAQLALGRLYYERDQPSKAIDSYLLVDRRSELFPDALYEVAWVYVKSKQYDKALRALELLSLSDPTSTKTPTVRILEGNLRIRKAQLIRTAQVTGTLDAKLKDVDPGVEYDKASAVFTDTHDMYMPSYVALSQMVDSTGDPSQYLAQLAGRSANVFQATAPLPEAAAQYLRDEPEVQRVVTVESDLAEVESDLAQSEQLIARLEGVLASADRTAVYPALQSRRGRIGQIQDDLIRMRAQLADELAGGGGGDASMRRRQLLQEYLALPNAEQAQADHVATVQDGFDKIEQAAADVSGVIDQTQAIAVALRKYANEAAPPLPQDQKATLAQTLDAAATEAAQIERELAAIQREIQLGRDLAGVADDSVAKTRALRKTVRDAEDAEHKALASAGGNQNVIAQGDRAARLAESLAATEQQLDAIADRGIAQVKTALAQERQAAAGYQVELDKLSAESRSIGGTVLGASFKDVKAKFYDVIVRTDVGNVDVAWSRKEDNDDDLKRLYLMRQRDLKQLRDEFRDILQDPGGALKPPPVKKPVPAPEAPTGAQTTSPDKSGAGDTRVKPGGSEPPKDTKPTVRPDNEQPKTAPKKGGTQ
jgi:tetratricopeptide (TPR) repeat protein